MSSAVVFAVIAATLYAAHQLGDHVLGQTDKQAANKAQPGWHGWRHDLAHVGLYHLVMSVMLIITITALDLPVTLLGLVAGMAFSAGSHAVIDRRWPVRWLLEHTGARPFSRLASNGLNGMYLADQALHYTALWIAAVLIACL